MLFTSCCGSKFSLVFYQSVIFKVIKENALKECVRAYVRACVCMCMCERELLRVEGEFEHCALLCV